MAATVVQIRLALLQQHVDPQRWAQGGDGLTTAAREKLLDALGSVGFMAELSRTTITAKDLQDPIGVGYLRESQRVLRMKITDLLDDELRSHLTFEDRELDARGEALLQHLVRVLAEMAFEHFDDLAHDRAP